MTWNPTMRRILIAIIISMALNVVLLTSTFLRGSEPDARSTLGRVLGALDSLSKPAAALTYWLFPGHGMLHLVVAPLIVSFLYFGGLAWLFLTAWTRLRRGSPED